MLPHSAHRPGRGGAARGGRCVGARHAAATRAMSFRRALALAACGLAGGSALFSAVAVSKQPARGDPEPRPGGSAAAPSAPAAPQGLLLLPPAASCPPGPGWIERPAGGGGFWDSNWDRCVRRREGRHGAGRRERRPTRGEMAAVAAPFVRSSSSVPRGRTAPVAWGRSGAGSPEGRELRAAGTPPTSWRRRGAATRRALSRAQSGPAALCSVGARAGGRAVPGGCEFV